MKSYNNDIFTEFYDNLEDFLKNYISSSYLCVHNNYIKPIHYKSENCCILQNYSKKSINISDNVTHLIIEYFYYHSVPKLPPNLLYLDAHGSTDLDFDVNNLPDSLLYIYWNTSYTCLTKLPPNLISLIVNSWKGAELTELPNTLTYLSCDVDCIHNVCAVGDKNHLLTGWDGNTGLTADFDREGAAGVVVHEVQFLVCRDEDRAAARACKFNEHVSGCARRTVWNSQRVRAASSGIGGVATDRLFNQRTKVGVGCGSPSTGLLSSTNEFQRKVS